MPLFILTLYFSAEPFVSRKEMDGDLREMVLVFDWSGIVGFSLP
jgi:hypothetical protein